MYQQWKSRYLELLQAMTAYSNNYAANWQKNIYHINELQVSAAEMQILSVILDNDTRQMKMIEISQMLDMPKSTFSRHIAALEKKGLVEKVHPSHNKKELIIFTTDKGRRIFDNYSVYIYTHVFRPVFDVLDAVSESDIKIMTHAMRIWRDAAAKDVTK